jgi:hypothetical protein
MFAEMASQIVDAAGSFADVKTGPVESRKPGAVVAAILEAAQSLNQNRLRFARTGIANDAAHGALLPEPTDDGVNP